MLRMRALSLRQFSNLSHARRISVLPTHIILGVADSTGVLTRVTVSADVQYSSFGIAFCSAGYGKGKVVRSVLYIRRDWSHKGIGTYFRRNILTEFYGQDGFFEAALDAGFSVSRMSASKVLANPHLISDYDAIVVNSRQHPKIFLYELLTRLSKSAKGPLVLFVSTPSPEDLPGDDVLERCDMIVKREPFRDFSRYRLRVRNLDKIRPTMLACHLVKARRGKLPNVEQLVARNYGRSVPLRYDVFFSGIASNRVRFETWQRVIKMGVNQVGGIQQKPEEILLPPDHPINGPKMSRRRYLKVARESRINLALDGVGPFTYRHLELWCVGAFMLSTPGIREIITPMRFQEGVHYVAFNDIDDMEDKIRYYLEHEGERRAIAEAGQKMFIEEYNIRRHAEQIRSWLSTI